MIGAYYLQRVMDRVRYGRLSCYDLALPLVRDKAGLEIGGPSELFRGWPAPLPLYKAVATLDNCNFSAKTTWSTNGTDFRFCSTKPAGKMIIADASDLAVVADNTYDFVLSSHNLEHIANPVKALMEWRRITRPGGGLILALPNYTKTFDHRREPTAVRHILDDYDRGIQEDDLTHLPEILQLHDLNMDPAAGTQEQFHQRSIDNFTNRCLHHHVFSETNSGELLSIIGMSVLAVETAPPHHIILVALMT